MDRAARRVTLALLVVVLALASPGWVPSAWAKDCNPKTIEVEATLNPDRSMDVVEHLGYDFDDECHGGIREIARFRGVSPIVVTEGGEPVPIDTARGGYVRWGQADVTVSGPHTYDLTYRVDGAVDVHADVAELYWQFLGNGFPDMDRVRIEIVTPGDGTGNRAFAHGVLEGVVTLSGNAVRLTVDDNPAGAIVEARVLMPPEGFGTERGFLPALDRILEEEAGNADRANVRREELRRQVERDEQRRDVGNIAGPAVALVGLGGFAALFAKWGREPRRPADISEYWRDIPEEPPAVCQAVLDFGTVGNGAFSATLVDLAQRGYVTIVEKGNDYRFTRTAKPAADVRKFEAKLLERLFGNQGTVTQDELVADAAASRTESAEWFAGFKASVELDVAGRNFVERTDKVKWLLLGLLVVGLGGFGVYLGGFLGAPAGWAALAAGAVVLVLSPLLRQRTQAGARKAAEVEGLRRFLRDFSRLDDEAYVGDIAIYERYLVYAVALGVSKELVKGLKVKFPQLSEANSGFAPWYVASSALGNGPGAGLDGVGSIGSFATEFTSATSAAFSPPSSSSGSGGGFSGGGGGGGGGGGAGGW
ncbi:MAG: DUF2207 family protein [Acidimicrobiia bacterium]